MCLYMYSAFVQFYHEDEDVYKIIVKFVPEMMNVGEFWGFHFSLNNALSLNYIVKWIKDISHCQTIETGLHVQVKGKN